MKMRRIYLFAIVLISMIISSCDLDINKDPNYPANVNADKYFASGQIWTASTVGGNLQLLGSIWAQQYAQHAGSNQYTGIDSYNIPNSDRYMTDPWGFLYAGALPDYKLAKQKAEAKGEWNYWMASTIMTAYSYHILVEAYGDIPFTEALDFHNIPNPKFDDAKSVNVAILAMLDEALAKLTDAKAVPTSMGENDLVFGGDLDLWAQFAKSLKLKILMRDPNFSTNSAAIQALLTENDLLTTDAKITIFEDKENNSNPLYENDRRKLNTQNNLRASSTLAKFLKENNDPRAGIFMEPTADAINGNPDPVWGEYVGIPQGGYTLGAAWGNKSSRARIDADDPVWFMSAAEVDFLKAEAYVQLGNTAEAQTNYENGVKAAFDRWNGETNLEGKVVIIPADFNVTSLIGPGMAYAFNTTSKQTMLESIWRQKWIAGVRCQGWESFLEVNRTGFPNAGTVTSEDPAYVVGQFAPSINTVLGAGEFPRRLIYPKTSSDYNPNTPAVVPIQNKLWWHK